MNYNEILKQISIYSFETSKKYDEINELNLKRLKLEKLKRKIDYPEEKEYCNQWMIDDLEEKVK